MAAEVTVLVDNSIVKQVRIRAKDHGIRTVEGNDYGDGPAHLSKVNCHPKDADILKAMADDVKKLTFRDYHAMRKAS